MCVKADYQVPTLSKVGILCSNQTRQTPGIYSGSHDNVVALVPYESRVCCGMAAFPEAVILSEESACQITFFVVRTVCTRGYMGLQHVQV